MSPVSRVAWTGRASHETKVFAIHATAGILQVVNEFWLPDPMVRVHLTIRSSFSKKKKVPAGRLARPCDGFGDVARLVWQYPYQLQGSKCYCMAKDCLVTWYSLCGLRPFGNLVNMVMDPVVKKNLLACILKRPFEKYVIWFGSMARRVCLW